MLPIFKSDLRSLDMMQTRWKSELDPLIKAPLASSLLLQGIILASGSNIINHMLGRTLQGWIITDITSNAVIYRSAAKNDQTLSLTSSANTTVDLLVF